MKALSLKDYTKVSVGKLLAEIPLFADLESSDHPQYRVLLSHAKIHELAPGETILLKGDKSSVFYVLLAGQVDVFGTDEITGAALDQLKPGQLFGTLGALTKTPRTASLAASQKGETILLAIDWESFGAMGDFSKLKLSTRLGFYRSVVNTTRWRLQMYKKEYPSEQLANALDSLKAYDGEPGTVDELKSLVTQAKGCAMLLDKWNALIAPTIDVDVGETGKQETSADGSIMKSVKGLFGKKS